MLSHFPETLILRLGNKAGAAPSTSEATDQSRRHPSRRAKSRRVITDSTISEEAHLLIHNGADIREIVQMLEQLDSAWKLSRHQCIVLEKQVESLTQQLHDARGESALLEKLCDACGIASRVTVKSVLSDGIEDVERNPLTARSEELLEQVDTAAERMKSFGRQVERAAIDDLERLRKKMSNDRRRSGEETVEDLLRRLSKGTVCPHPPPEVGVGPLTARLSAAINDKRRRLVQAVETDVSHEM